MKKHLSFLLALCMIFSMAVIGTTPVLAAEKTEYSEDIVKAAQRALDTVEVENVIGKHEYYHSALNHLDEFLDIWVNEDPWMETMSWTNNTQKMVGAYNVYGFMVTDLVANISMSIDSAMENDTQGTITNDPEWYGTGMFWYHMLMTPMIVVADDGQTARGAFQSFGTVTGPMGEMSSQWTCESYGFDCAKMSTGEWRIWHLRTFVYFYCETDDGWTDMRTNTAASGAGAANAPVGVGVMYDEDGNQITGQTYLDSGSASGEPSDMTPPGGDMTPPEMGGGSGEPSGGMGGYVRSDYEVEIGEYFTGFSIYKVPESVPMPYEYSTWAEVEANGDGY